MLGVNFLAKHRVWKHLQPQKTSGETLQAKPLMQCSKVSIRKDQTQPLPSRCFPYVQSIYVMCVKWPPRLCNPKVRITVLNAKRKFSDCNVCSCAYTSSWAFKAGILSKGNDRIWMRKCCQRFHRSHKTLSSSSVFICTRVSRLLATQFWGSGPHVSVYLNTWIFFYSCKKYLCPHYSVWKK